MTRVEAHLHIGRYRRGEEKCISVRSLPNGLTNHCKRLYLSDVTFAVQPAGYARWVATGVKNVHAYVRGTDLGFSPRLHVAENMRPIGYRPNYGPYFFDKVHGNKVESASLVKMVGSQMFYLP